MFSPPSTPTPPFATTGYAVSVDAGFALVSAFESYDETDVLTRPDIFHSKVFLYSRTSNLAKWTLSETFVSPFNSSNSDYAGVTIFKQKTQSLRSANIAPQPLQVVDANETSPDGPDLDDIASDILEALDHFGCSIVLFNGPVNTSASIAIAADLGDGVAQNSGIVYVQTVVREAFVYEVKQPSKSVSGNEQIDFFSIQSVGIFFALICGIVVPSTAVAAVLIYRYKSQGAVNKYEKASQQQSSVPEEFELTSISNPAHDLSVI